MKGLITALTAATALTFVGNARADDTKTSESKSTVKQKDDGTSSTKVEKKATHDAPGMKNDTKSDVKETTETDAKGNVVKHEKTGPEGKTEPVK